ncbi:MAG: class I SAM-dependent methyltransferase [Planctomycetota bacterium]|nr:class I SAM-dependent methyltransferase [Planctomycetota bacterium]
MNSVLQLPKIVGQSAMALAQGRNVIMIPDAPPLEPRYGHGQPPHAGLYKLIDTHRESYRATLQKIVGLSESLASIPRIRNEETDGAQPCWDNRWLPGLDSAALYGLLTIHKPQHYIEIGSGNSTLFTRRAIRDHDLPTTITSIDPQPREEIDAICDEVHRVPVQDVDLSIFDRLESGDIMFVDSSHRVFTNSDVTAIFLDVLPRLKPGVLVHFHDIWLPEDYQPAWSNRYYTEQYLLAALLLFGDQFEIVLPNNFITKDADLSNVLSPLWQRPEMQGVRTDGASFWIRKKS